MNKEREEYKERRNRTMETVRDVRVVVERHPSGISFSEKEVVVVEQTLKIVMEEPYEVRPSIPTEERNPAMVALRRKEFQVQMTRNRQPVRNYPFRLWTDYVEGTGGHNHDNTRNVRRPDNNDNYGYFTIGASRRAMRPLDTLANQEGRREVVYNASIFGDSMRIYVSSRDVRKAKYLRDSVTVVERVAGLELLPDGADYVLIGGTCNNHGPSDRGIADVCQTPDNNHWGTAEVVRSIQNIAREYRQRFRNAPRLMINDISLHSAEDLILTVIGKDIEGINIID